MEEAFKQAAGDQLPFNIPESLSKMVERHLEAEIVEGRLPAGTRLNPEEIARRLNISKSPVREAMILLQREGLVTGKPRSIFVVSEINLADLHEIYPIRAAFNALAVKTIMQSPSATATVEALSEYLAKMRLKAKKGDTTEYFHASIDFYDFLISSCPNKRLQTMWHQLSKQVLRFRFLVMSQPGHIQRSIADHQRLLAAMKEGSVEKAMQVAEEILTTSLADLDGILRSENSPRAER
ncbi:MAG: GntR family transcriptional regulator [Rhodocyclaceae bacterium]|nr:MAG: GntR family transcriptional regulator [Rhodocyclaceae bacterium]